jgi:hypothetical protein
MKILFLCGSTEPGKDGVGDYTRRLAGVLIQKGHEVEILSLFDKHSTGFRTEKQIIEETTVAVNRIGKDTVFKQRLKFTHDLLGSFNPSWISIQYVPYGFHAKGLPFWLPNFLKQLKGNHKWHIMFHEIWLGIEQNSTLKNKLIGVFQKIIVKKLVKHITPTGIHTQAKIYQYYLNKKGIKADYLPLFGNIKIHPINNIDDYKLTFVVFASIRNHAPFNDFIKDLNIELRNKKKKAKFIFIGNNGNQLQSWTSALKEHRIPFEEFGISSEEKISHILSTADYGISSTPYKLSDKSGIVAALLDHRLPIINVAKPWIDNDDIEISFQNVTEYKKGMQNITTITTDIHTKNTLNSIYNIFYKSIKDIFQ